MQLNNTAYWQGTTAGKSCQILLLFQTM